MKKAFPFNLNAKSTIIILILFLAGLIFLTGLYFNNQERKNLLNQKEKELSSISKIKINQINKWFKDELDDARTISSNIFLLEKVKNVINEKKEIQSCTEILNQIKKEHDYLDVFLTNLDGDIIVSTSRTVIKLDTNIIKGINESVKNNSQSFTDIFSSHSYSKSVLTGFISPVLDENKKQISVLVFIHDVNTFLYPILNTDQDEKSSLESFIFKLEDDSIIFLSQLKYRKDAPLKFKLPAVMSDLISVKGVKGFAGITKGKDYRGKGVYAFVNSIPSTPWYIVTKIDEDEIFEKMVSELSLNILLVILLVLLCAVGIAFIYNSNQKKVYRELYKKEKELWQFQEKFKVTIDCLGDGVVTTDINGKVLFLNKRAEQLTGWSNREARGRLLKEIYPVINEQTGEHENNIIEKVFKHGIVKELANHTILISKNGNKIPVMDTGAPIFDSDGSTIGLVIAFQDETERREQQRLLRESEYRLRSSFNSMIEGCQIIGHDWHYMFINDSAERHNRRPKEELLGKKYMDMWPGIEKTEVFGLLKKCMEERTPQQIENDFTFPDGKVGSFKVNIEPVPEGILILTEDVTERKRVEKNLQEKTNILESFFENTLTLIAMLDKNFNFIRVNKAYADSENQDVDFFIGKNHFDLYPSDAKSIFEEVVRTKSVYRAIERPFTYSDNPQKSVTYWDWTLMPLLNKNSEVESLILTMLNVSERVKAKEKLVENEKFLTSLFNSINDAIFIISIPDRKILNVNNAVSDLFGCEPEELIGKKTQSIFASEKDFYEYGEKLSAAIKENQPFFRTELPFKNKEGLILYCDIQTTFIKSTRGDVLAISVMRDMTEKKKMVNELIEAKEKAEEMNKIKSNFFANMSHELRTPFVGILGYSEILNDMTDDPDMKEIIAGITNSSKRMQKTLTQLLNFSKLDAEVRRPEFKLKRTFNNVNITELINLTSKEFIEDASEKNLTFIINNKFEKNFIVSDQALLSEILCNLFSNAVIYTEKGGIEVSIFEKYFDNRNQFVISITDTGIGISDDKQELIWHEFRQASEGLDRRYEGTGLGLYIAKKYAELLGGTITLISKVNVGSTFSLIIPVEASVESIDKKQIALKYEVIENTQIELVNLLYVEDDYVSIDVVKRILPSKYKINFASTAEEAIEKVKQNSFDGILMDINLKKSSNGVLLTQLIRKLPGYGSIPIIAVTAYALESDKVEFLSKGMTHYIAKPFKREDLISLLDEIFYSKWEKKIN